MKPLLIGAGAGAGASLGYLITLIPSQTGLALILINAIGCFLLGAKPRPAWWSTGFLGGFTSFSSYCLLSYENRTFLYFVGTALLCVLAWFSGDRVHTGRTRK